MSCIWYEYYDSEEQEFWEGLNNSRTSRINEWEKVCEETGKCTRCPPHRGENSTKGKFKKKSKLKYQIRRDKKFLNVL